MSIYLASIFIYPVKSLAGIGVTTWPVTNTGLKYDRKWMLVDESGLFLSQRKLPRMALIHTSLTNSELILSASGMLDLAVPLEAATGDIIPSTVWHHQGPALCVSPEADSWLSHFLGRPCRLVYQPDDCIRPVDPIYAKPVDQTSFSDGFPFLIVSESSLAALNFELDAPVGMSRFRPNLVIGGCNGYAEDEWREISIGTIDFRLPKACSRCSVPAIDPGTGEIGKEPLSTLNKLRNWNNKIYFGQNALHDQCGLLSVGDTLTVNVSGNKQPPL